MLRVKDGMFFLLRWLENIGSLVDEIVVVDNGSTDGTYEHLQKHPKVISIDRTEGFDEGRDKILAYKRAKERNPDWIIWLDVDEIFEDRMTRQRVEKMMASRWITRYFFRRFHLQGDERHFKAARINLWCNSWPDRVLWKDQPTGYFRNIHIHNGLICGIRGLTWPSSIRIRHFANLEIDTDYVDRKTETYIRLDPAQGDMYTRHRDERVHTWPWYEFCERPGLVILQTSIHFLIFLFRYSLHLIVKLMMMLLLKCQRRHKSDQKDF